MGEVVFGRTPFRCDYALAGDRRFQPSGSLNKKTLGKSHVETGFLLPRVCSVIKARFGGADFDPILHDAFFGRDMRRVYKPDLVLLSMSSPGQSALLRILDKYRER